MSKSESSSCKSVNDSRIDVRIVTIPITLWNYGCMKNLIQTGQQITLTSFCKSNPNFSITSFPRSIGKNSLYAMCCIMAMLILLDSWKSVSSSQCGLTCAKFCAIVLCWRAINVCMQVRTSCSFTRISPGMKESCSSSNNVYREKMEQQETSGMDSSFSS